MPLDNELPSDLDEVDIIVAGGGTAGCIVAARLAAADPSMSILVIEAGPNNDRDSIVNPGLSYENMNPTSGILNIHVESKPSPALGNRHAFLTAANVLGGGSSINLMLYVRAQRSDFDSWNTSGWSSEELLPYLKKLETFHANPGSTHGQDGPVHISQGGFTVPKSQQDIIEACKLSGYPEFADLQDLDSCNGVERHLGNISPDGKRQDTASVYLHPLLDHGRHPHLHVLCQHRVVRVLFNAENTACGVELASQTDPTVRQPDILVKTVRARKLVVVSGGAFGTPAILERSGIGSSEILKRGQIPVISELPGVGQDFQDHPLMWVPYHTNLEPTETGDALTSGQLPRDEALADKNPMLGWNYTDVLTKIRPTEDEVAALGPEFKTIWDRDFRDHPERPLTLSGFVNVLLIARTNLPKGQYMSAIAYSAYPCGRGQVHITGPSLADPLEVDSGYLSGEAAEFDLLTHVWAYKKHRDIMRRTKLYRGELAVNHPVYSENSAAKTVNLVGQQEALIEQGEVSNLHYTEKDDAAIRDYIRAQLTTAGHCLGTSKMAPREESGVVDRHLNVYGVTASRLQT